MKFTILLARVARTAKCHVRNMLVKGIPFRHAKVINRQKMYQSLGEGCQSGWNVSVHVTGLPDYMKIWSNQTLLWSYLIYKSVHFCSRSRNLITEPKLILDIKYCLIYKVYWGNSLIYETTRHPCYRASGLRLCHSGMSSWPYNGSYKPKWETSNTFKYQFQAHRDKMYWNLFWKIPGFVLLVVYKTHFGASLTSPVCAIIRSFN